MITPVIARRSPKRSYSYVNGLRVTEWVQLWRTVDVLQQHYKIWNIVQRVFGEVMQAVWKFVCLMSLWLRVCFGMDRRLSTPVRDSAALFDNEFLVGCLLSNVVDPAGRPPHDNGLDLRGCSKAKVKTRVAG